MAQTENNAQAPNTHTLKLKGTGTEYPARFDGQEVTYEVPVAVPGDVDATLGALRARVADDADFAEVLADYFNGYGLTYAVNGTVKRFLNSEEAAGMSVEDAVAEATRRANAYRVGSVRKGTGTGKGGKVKQLEAKVDAAKASVLTIYRDANKSVRKAFRPQLIAGGLVTEAELDEIDAES